MCDHQPVRRRNCTRWSTCARWRSGTSRLPVAASLTLHCCSRGTTGRCPNSDTSHKSSSDWSRYLTFRCGWHAQSPSTDVLQLLCQDGQAVQPYDSPAADPAPDSPLPLHSSDCPSSSRSLLDEVVALQELVAAVLAERSISIESAGKAAVDRRRSAGSRPTPAELWRYLRKLGNAVLTKAIGGPVCTSLSTPRIRRGRGPRTAKVTRVLAPTQAQLALTAVFRLDRAGQLSPAELRHHFDLRPPEGGWPTIWDTVAGRLPEVDVAVGVDKCGIAGQSFLGDRVAADAGRGTVPEGPAISAGAPSCGEGRHRDPEDTNPESAVRLAAPHYM